MLKILTGRTLSLLVASAAILFAPLASADDTDDVMAVVQQWADTESDLDAQARLISDDRVQIFGMVRQTDQAGNLRVQKANAAGRAAAGGGTPQIIVRIESPQVSIYGSTAIVSFVRLFNVIPHNAAPLPGQQAFFTLVLVKDRNNWKIVHSHGSAAN